jgi:hypothetical protein
MIEKSFNKLYPYLKGIKKTDNYRIIETNLKSTWEINLIDEVSVKDHIFFSESLTFDDLLEWFKTNVVEYNLEIEEKERLLKMKVEELKRVFESKNLDELNNLKFTTEDDVLSLTKKEEKEYENNTEEKIT